MVGLHVLDEMDDVTCIHTHTYTFHFPLHHRPRWRDRSLHHGGMVLHTHPCFCLIAFFSPSETMPAVSLGEGKGFLSFLLLLSSFSGAVHRGSQVCAGVGSASRCCYHSHRQAAAKEISPPSSRRLLSLPKPHDGALWNQGESKAQQQKNRYTPHMLLSDLQNWAK